MENPFSWSYLTAPLSETETFGPFSIFYLVMMGAIFIVSVFVVRDAPHRFADHKLKRDTLMSGATILMWASGVSLFFFIPRWMRFEILTFERRIWLYICFTIVVAIIGYFVYYLKVKYPPLLAEFERKRERRKYVAPAQAGQARTRRSGSKSKRQRANR
ncbi:MAG: hypothetical protein DCC58_04905 [Chloroflexi bacterium]|nr:MAG: hypothetical protein DCC58_04905 [Chloroflexota bacterium]